MKKIILLPLLLLLFTACNSEKTKNISNDAFQQAHATRSFPQASRNPDEVICQNCHAKFKVSRAMHKMSNGKVYIICPICHHRYLKKSN